MRYTAHCYYSDILKSKGDMSAINETLNDAIKDSIVPSSTKEQYNYSYLCSVSKSLGFNFSTDWRLL